MDIFRLEILDNRVYFSRFWLNLQRKQSDISTGRRYKQTNKQKTRMRWHIRDRIFAHFGKHICRVTSLLSHIFLPLGEVEWIVVLSSFIYLSCYFFSWFLQSWTPSIHLRALCPIMLRLDNPMRKGWWWRLDKPHLKKRQ